MYILQRVKAPANEETFLWKHCFSKCFLDAQTSSKQKNCFASLLRQRGNFLKVRVRVNRENNVSSFAVALKYQKSTGHDFCYTYTETRFLEYIFRLDCIFHPLVPPRPKDNFFKRYYFVMG